MGLLSASRSGRGQTATVPFAAARPRDSVFLTSSPCQAFVALGPTGQFGLAFLASSHGPAFVATNPFVRLVQAFVASSHGPAFVAANQVFGASSPGPAFVAANPSVRVVQGCISEPAWFWSKHCLLFNPHDLQVR